MTRIYIIRHGDALPLGGEARRDADRPLTTRGEEDIRRAGKFLAGLDRNLRRIHCSPLLRARQTAELIASAIGGKTDVRPTESLAPGFRPVLLMEELHGSGKAESVAVVGHQPDLSILLAYLIECEAASALSFPPGAIACIELSGGPAPDPTLQWLLTPDLLRRLQPEM